MSRKLTAATLALTGGVYLLAGPAQASNMGFKLERSFAVVRDGGPAGAPFKNFYLVSFPIFNGLGDVANSSVGGDKCAAGPDGTVDSVDALCDLWTDKTIPGSFAISRFNRDTCLFEVTPGSFDAFSGVDVGAPFALDRDFGYAITVASDEPAPPQNRAVIVGSHDPSYTGRDVRVPPSRCTPMNDIIEMHYHTMYQTANEILCGLEGVAWVDTAPADGNPDTCPDGIFDNTSSIAVGFFDNTDDNSTAPYGDNEIRFRGALFDPFGGLQFFGPNFALVPGEGYLLAIDPAHTTTTWVQPHF
jgi:hypothetical protein